MEHVQKSYIAAYDSDGREHWSSAYGRDFYIQKVVSLNPSTRYWMDIFSQ